MKVTLEKEYRSRYTLEDIDAAKIVIAAEKDDGEKPAGWLEYAVNEYLKNKNDYLVRIIEAKAETARNCRAWNLYGTGESKDMDVWISGIAKTADGFLEIGAYLSDIWQTGAVDYRHHMYATYYTEKSA